MFLFPIAPRENIDKYNKKTLEAERKIKQEVDEIETNTNHVIFGVLNFG